MSKGLEDRAENDERKSYDTVLYVIKWGYEPRLEGKKGRGEG
jgi:hypothetical protein